MPQYIAGRDLFSRNDPHQPVRPWALAIAAILAVWLLVVVIVVLWKWLVRGVPPQTQLRTALRKIRALVLVGLSRRAKEVIKRNAAAISVKLKLPDEVHLPGRGIKAHKEERHSLLAEVSTYSIWCSQVGPSSCIFTSSIWVDIVGDRT
jgi:hypothetical protein